VRFKKVLAMLGVALPIAVVVIAGLVGLAVVAYFVLMSVALSSWGSNK
jgi:hypothetical protein